MAIVVDEFGGTEGIITMEDIVEEILGDAVPRGDVDPYIEPLEDGKFLVSGNARLDDLSEYLGFQIEAEGIDTIGGFVFTRLGYLPPSGHKTRNSTARHYGAARWAKANRGAPAGKNNRCRMDEAPGRRQRCELMIGFIIFCCWIVSFFFNGIESGLLSIDPVRLRQNVKRRVPAAVRLNRLLKHPERLLVTVLLITNAADIVGLLLLTRQLVRSWGYAGFFFSLAIALPVYLFLLSVLPKSLFRRFPFRALARLAGILEFASILFSPLLELGARLGRLLLPGRAAKRARLFAAREELKQITTQSEREGSLTATERAMIHNVVDFRGVKVRDVMVPLPKVVAVRPSTSTQEALALSASSGRRSSTCDYAGRSAGWID